MDHLFSRHKEIVVFLGRFSSRQWFDHFTKHQKRALPFVRTQNTVKNSYSISNIAIIACHCTAFSWICVSKRALLICPLFKTIMRPDQDLTPSFLRNENKTRFILPLRHPCVMLRSTLLQRAENRVHGWKPLPPPNNVLPQSYQHEGAASTSKKSLSRIM